MTDSSNRSSSTPPPPPPGAAPTGSPPPAAPGAQPAAQPAQPAKKKGGIPPLAWLAMGCGCLVILAGISTIFLGGFLWRKTSEVVSEFGENPVMAVAERAVEASPDVELVSSDWEAMRLEIRDKKTGETYWIDAADISKGQIRFGKGDEERSLTFDGEDGQGSVRFEGPEGESNFRIGSGAGGEIPDWLPIFPGAEREEGVFSLDTPEGRSGSVTLSTDQSVEEVVDFYIEELEADGWEVSRATYKGAMGEGATLGGTSADGGRTVRLAIGRQDGVTRVGVFHSGR